MLVSGPAEMWIWTRELG